jgi:hypothetical protein
MESERATTMLRNDEEDVNPALVLEELEQLIQQPLS